MPSRVSVESIDFSIKGHANETVTRKRLRWRWLWAALKATCSENPEKPSRLIQVLPDGSLRKVRVLGGLGIRAWNSGI